MTRRIAITILLTVWAAIIVAGLTAWLTARAVLLHDLDASIIDRVRTLASQEDSSASAAPFPGDRYVVKGMSDRTLERQPRPGVAARDLTVISAGFVRLPEGSFRRLTVRLPATPMHEPSTIVYSAPSAAFDGVLRTLAIALAVCGSLAGAVAAAVAARMARVALRPLSETAAVVGGVNDSTLDRRIDEASLPVELRPMAAQLNQMLARLESAFTQRRQFLADASHELRTPVAAMITTIEVALRRPRPAAELGETLQTCLTEARHMRRLVQALFRQIRAENGWSAEERVNLNASDLVGECAELARSMAVERNIRLVRQTEPSVPIFTEPERLRSVVMNLVSNAIEYVEPGGVVEISASSENGSACVTVKDNGPGIAEEHLPHLFEPFYRVNSARNADGHLGLGLFLVGSHVKAMGGICKVDSQIGRGTTFVIRLPSQGPSASLTEAKS